MPGALTYVPRVQQKIPKSQRKFAAKKMRPVYICGMCKSDCKDEDDISDAKDYSVSCDKYVINGSIGVVLVSMEAAMYGAVLNAKKIEMDGTA